MTDLKEIKTQEQLEQEILKDDQRVIDFVECMEYGE